MSEEGITYLASSLVSRTMVHINDELVPLALRARMSTTVVSESRIGTHKMNDVIVHDQRLDSVGKPSCTRPWTKPVV